MDAACRAVDAIPLKCSASIPVVCQVAIAMARYPQFNQGCALAVKQAFRSRYLIRRILGFAARHNVDRKVEAGDPKVRRHIAKHFYSTWAKSPGDRVRPG